MSLKTIINFGLQARLSATVAGDTGAMPHSAADQLIWASGTGADQADKVYADSGSLSASAVLTMDFAPGSDDAFGSPATMARIKAVYVQNTGATASISLGGNNSFFGAGLVLRPGETVMKAVGATDATGWAVAAGSTDVLSITNQSGAAAASYRVIVVGASA